jgi:predicted Zn-dependent peptidase
MQTHTYKNGFRLVYQHLANPETSIQMYCDFGSIHEPADGRGAAHFIEHMCFKGTRRLHNTKELSTVFDKSGAFLNAFTDRRTTCYYVSGTTTDFAEKINTLCDMMLNSVFNPTEYNKEHNVVREEMHKDADDAELTAIENADKYLFAGTNYALPVDTLEYHTAQNALPRSRVYNIYKNNYIPANFILSICSSLRWSEVKRIVDQCLLAKAEAVVQQRPMLPMTLVPILRPVITTGFQAGLSTTHLCVGFRTCSRAHADAAALLFASAALSSTMNARMFFVFREKHGLSYTSSCQTDFFETFGAIRFYVECDTKKFQKTYAVMKTLLRDLAAHGLTLQEFNLTRGYLQGQYALKTQDPTQISGHNGEQLLYGDPVIVNYADFYNHFIAPLTLASVNACLTKYLTINTAVTSVVSSDKELLRHLQKV